MIEGRFKFNTVFAPTSAIPELEGNGFGAKRLKINLSQARILQPDETAPTNTDVLVLLDEEAIFLISINRMQIFNVNQSLVSVDDLWRCFVAKNSNFSLKYKVYEHFKQKEMVVKSGLHFGVDYVVYRYSPLLCHSEFCVLVVDAMTTNSTDGEVRSLVTDGTLTWRQLGTLTRVAPDVNKMLLLCYVTNIDNHKADSTAVPVQLQADATPVASAATTHQLAAMKEGKSIAEASSVLVPQLFPCRDDAQNKKHAPFSLANCSTTTKVTDSVAGVISHSSTDRVSYIRSIFPDWVPTEQICGFGLSNSSCIHPDVSLKSSAGSDENVSFTQLRGIGSVRETVGDEEEIGVLLSTAAVTPPPPLPQQQLSLSTMACLEHMTVRTATVVVRRLPAVLETYQDVGEQLQVLRRASMLKKARVQQTVAKHRADRRDPNEIRSKIASKGNRARWNSVSDKVAVGKDPSQGSRDILSTEVPAVLNNTAVCVSNNSINSNSGSSWDVLGVSRECSKTAGCSDMMEPTSMVNNGITMCSGPNEMQAVMIIPNNETNTSCNIVSSTNEEVRTSRHLQACTALLDLKFQRSASKRQRNEIDWMGRGAASAAAAADSTMKVYVPPVIAEDSTVSMLVPSLITESASSATTNSTPAAAVAAAPTVLDREMQRVVAKRKHPASTGEGGASQRKRFVFIQSDD